MVLECDVLVVGAGPAGASAARAAAQAGLDVICIEKKKKPGVPVQCAEGIGSYILPHMPFNLPKHVLEWKIDGIIFKTEDISIKNKGDFWEGYSVDRVKLETWLVKEATKNGARVFLDSELIDLEYNKDYIVRAAKIHKAGKEKTIKPKILIAADGVEARTLKIIGEYNPQKGSLVDCHTWEMHNVNLSNPHFEEIYVGDFVPGGYAWVFPKSKDTANIGVGGLYPSKHISEYFEHFLELKDIKKQIKDAKWIYDKSRYAVFDNICKEPSYGNIFLAGDCANHNFKPFVEGILPGIISGDFIGKISKKIINGDITNEDYKKYEKNIFSQFMGDSNLSKSLLHELYERWDRRDHLLFISFVSELFEIERLDEFKEAELAELEESILLKLSKNK